MSNFGWGRGLAVAQYVVPSLRSGPTAVVPERRVWSVSKSAAGGRRALSRRESESADACQNLDARVNMVVSDRGPPM